MGIAPKKKLFQISLVAMIVGSLCSSALAETPRPLPTVCEAEMIAAAERHQVPLAVLYAVALTETGRKGSLQPFAMNVEGASVFASSKPDALLRFASARRAGAKLIDVGCMQINHHYHGARFRSVEEMFEPRANVEYGAQFLKRLRQSHGSWTIAVARYHAGPDNTPAQKRYVCAVIRNMIASGLGQRTAAADRFCR